LWHPVPYVLGLDGTPDARPDGLSEIVKRHLGPAMYQKDVPGFDAADAEFTGEVWRINYAGHPDFCEAELTPSGTVCAINTIAKFNKDPHRLQLIVQQVLRLYRMHETPEAVKYGVGRRPGDAPDAPKHRHGVFVFAEHRDALIVIRDALAARLRPDEISAPELESARTMTVLRGGVAPDELSKAQKAGEHIVLTTYGYSRRGISLRKMTASVHTSPRRHGMAQIGARIRRRGSDQLIRRVIVDIVDVRTPLKSQYSERAKQYKAWNYPVVTKDVSYDSPALRVAETKDSKEPALLATHEESGDVNTGDIIWEGDAEDTGDTEDTPSEETTSASLADLLDF
jgi:hypothetical protein